MGLPVLHQLKGLAAMILLMWDCIEIEIEKDLCMVMVYERSSKCRVKKASCHPLSKNLRGAIHSVEFGSSDFMINQR